MAKGNTPEGKVKDAVRRVLARHNDIYSHWPVPYGYGRSTLDWIGCFHGVFIAIETKAPGEVPTRRQKQIIGEIERAGGKVFVIDNVNATQPLEQFLEDIKRNAASTSQS